jgi:DNA-directed RNA polymerase subunit beta
MLIKAYGEDQELPEGDEARAELGRNLANGVPIATPVFDGAREDDINDHAAARRLRQVRPVDAA